MARRRRDDGRSDQPAPIPTPKSGVDALGLATLGGTIAVLMISFANMRSIDRLAGNVDQIEDRIARGGQAPAAQGQAPAQPAQNAQRSQRPDPNRVYEVRTANAPAKGPAQAPVVIAEFSDFQ